MESKVIYALVLLGTGTAVGTALARRSAKLLDAAFMLFVVGCVLSHKLDVNLISRSWYRGTTRGIELSFVDGLALIVLLAALYQRKAVTRQAMHWPSSLGLLIAYLGYCGLNVLISEPSIFGLFEWTKIARGLMVFLATTAYLTHARKLHNVYAALIAAVLLQAGFALVQRYVWGVHRVPGLMAHPNGLSMYANMAAPLLLSGALSSLPSRLRVACGVAWACALVSVLLSISRTGYVTAILVALGVAAVSVRPRFSTRGIAIGLAACLGASLAIHRSWDTVSQRLFAATLQEEAKQGRGVYWRLARLISEDHPLGVGLNNWSFAVSNEYGPRVGIPYSRYPSADKEPPPDNPFGLDDPQAPPAHTIVGLTYGELGLPGLLLLGALWFRWLHMGKSFLFGRTRRVAHRTGCGVLFSLIAVSMQSLTEWSFRETPLFLSVHMLAAVLCVLYDERREAPARRSVVRTGARGSRPKPDRVGHRTAGPPPTRG